MMTDCDDLMIPIFIGVLYAESSKRTTYHVLIVSKAKQSETQRNPYGHSLTACYSFLCEVHSNGIICKTQYVSSLSGEDHTHYRDAVVRCSHNVVAEKTTHVYDSIHRTHKFVMEPTLSFVPRPQKLLNRKTQKFEKCAFGTELTVYPEACVLALAIVIASQQHLVLTV